MQIIAMLTMLVDHIGRMFFADQFIWGIIGRIAFPFYAHMFVKSYDLTRDRKSYLKRLFYLAIISQIPYSLSFETIDINVVASLTIYLLIFTLVGRFYSKLIKVTFVVIGAALLEFLHFDYGAYGLFLAMIYRYSDRVKMILLHYLLNLTALVCKGWVAQMFSLFSTAMVLVFRNKNWFNSRVVPIHIWRYFYPVHLFVLWIISIFVK
ncbi:conjugal transfer protein TraX [Paenibacillus alvei]|uniref:TraX family protein n=1 Tax=Paenibacillus alvei TaxID=44250 RepID=UPI000289FDB7|nr:TraX family protein [Paenibacillus alvei]EJW13888.1 TraX family protein [Paenibacillus alvei DSM 29]MCY9540495.1 conjugal transfer protein TraX [Paenibacillus alvei]MCY9708301.1 conjugal transfer protein TraX [Paenibacillus alvei]MCY9733011.1 conjugal transfer protein TraX [Paenibacillus alvei]MCY9755222.1 conjugal transfer protein TraX [Paenibacillus alvei]